MTADPTIPEAPPVRVLIVDDQPLIRAGFAAIVRTTDGLEVVGEAGDGAEAVDLAERLRPDVVLLDIRMPTMDGIEACRRIAAHPDLHTTRVLVLTTFETDEHVAEALRAGASGFLGKDVDPEALIAAIRTVAAGEALLSPTATRSLIARYLAAPSGPLPTARAAESGLTARETAVVARVALGLDNAAIAERLVVSPLTAKTHVTRAISKVGARDRAQLVAWAYRSGLMDAADPRDGQGPADR